MRCHAAGTYTLKTFDLAAGNAALKPALSPAWGSANFKLTIFL
jgi:hypothetical protein